MWHAQRDRRLAGGAPSALASVESVESCVRRVRRGSKAAPKIRNGGSFVGPVFFNNPDTVALDFRASTFYNRLSSYCRTITKVDPLIHMDLEIWCL